jgi:hypothetical protein
MGYPLCCFGEPGCLRIKSTIGTQNNAEVPGELATLAANARVPLIYISTDAVFDGKG